MNRNRLAELHQAAAIEPDASAPADSTSIPMMNIGSNDGSGADSQSPDSSYFNNPDASEDEAFMAKFFSLVSDVRKLMNEIEAKIHEIETEHGQALAAISQKQSQKSSEQLETLMREVQALANQVRKKLKEMDNDIAEGTATVGGDNAAVRIKDSQKSILSRKFVKLMSEYNEIQTQYKQKYRDRVKRQLKIVKPEAGAEEVNQILDSDRDPGAIFANEIMTHSEAKQALEDIQDRHKDILKLEKSIRELHELFLDMAILVNQQGEMIDQIEFNIGQAGDFIGESKKQLKVAAKYKASARRKKICIVLILILIIIVVVVPNVVVRR